MIGLDARAFVFSAFIVAVAIVFLVYKAVCKRRPGRISKKLQRGSNYRKRYFAHKKGIFGIGLYFCPYCGKLMWRKEQIQVDHINSVHRVQNNAILRNRFVKLPEGVNNIRNLFTLAPGAIYAKEQKVDYGFF